MRTFTVSEILCYQECPSLWAYKYFATARPVIKGTSAPAWMRGNAVHGLLDALARSGAAELNHGVIYEGLSALYEQMCDAEGVIGNLDELYRMSFAVTDYWNTLGVHTGPGHGAEITLEAKLPNNTTLRGKLDLLYSDTLGVWHRQFKTVGSSRENEDFKKLVARSLHESAYRALVEANFDAPYAGTDLIIIPGDPIHAREAGAECTHCGKRGLKFRPTTYEREKIRIRDALMNKRSHDIVRVTDEILRAEDILKGVGWPASGGPPPLEQREQACRNRYSRRLCAFMPICDFRAGSGLDPENFEIYDPNARYKVDESWEIPDLQASKEK